MEKAALSGDGLCFIASDRTKLFDPDPNLSCIAEAEDSLESVFPLGLILVIHLDSIILHPVLVEPLDLYVRSSSQYPVSGAAFLWSLLY